MSYTGPVSRLTTIKWPGETGYQYYRDQSVYKTTPGTRRSETPYLGLRSFFDSASKYGSVGSNAYPSCNTTSNQDPIGRCRNDYYGLGPRALNRARARFITALKECRETSIGASLAEFDKTLLMIGDRAKQLWTFAKRLRRGDFPGAARALRVPEGHRSEAKSFGGAFLEYHFGWSPLLGDIHDGMELISAPLPSDGRVRGRGRALAVQQLVKSYDSGGSLPQRRYLSGTFEVRCELRGLTELVNPNLDLLQSLGLVNPAEVAWELVPFSFLVDHVVGIGDFLHSFSDELGWKVTDVGLSRLDSVSGSYKADFSIGGAYPYGWQVGAHCAVFSRSLSPGLPPYSLAFTNPFTGLSATRAATYIALLLQVL